MQFKKAYCSVALVDFPHFVINREMKEGTGEYINEMKAILQNYYDYKIGADFIPEGTKGDYVPSDIRFKNIKSLIDKEARFMFSQMPDVNIESVNVSDAEQIEPYRVVIQRVIEDNNFSGILLQAAKDCFIGKRVACVIDYSERTGIGLKFYDSLHFYYETEYGSTELTKLVTFEDVSKAKHLKSKHYLVNRYERANNVVKMSSIVYNNGGKMIETLIPEQTIDFDYIPAEIIYNAGVLSDIEGVSDVEDLKGYESGYNLISNSDIDSERKAVNPVIVLIDINHRTTEDLSSSPGSVWDLDHNQEVDDPKPSAQVLAPPMTHVEAVKTTLDRIKSTMYGELDIPDISVEGTLSGITSYKAIRALYFPLTVRCDEKLKSWKTKLTRVFKIVLDFCKKNSDKTKELYEVSDLPDVRYKITIVENYALLVDENEEKQIDLDEVNAMARSRYSYLKKWRLEELKNNDGIEEEISRIVTEQSMIDALSMSPSVQKDMEEEQMKQDLEDDIEIVESEGNIK